MVSRTREDLQKVLLLIFVFLFLGLKVTPLFLRIPL
jgi:hypothetical protein